MSNQKPGRFRRRTDRGGGQTLVEFALILPLFMVLLLGVIEFAFMFNATLAINFASRNASLIAAEAGSQSTADCAILSKIESDVGAPLDKTMIQKVTIYQADRAGNQTALANTYTRTGSTTCTGFTPNSVPYTLSGGSNYPQVRASATTPGRCDMLAGCPSSTTPNTSIPMDSIGVTIVYRYTFKTPLRNLVSFLPGASVGYLDFSWSNVMRMEPVL
jgi:Flp pilus assembly protein TadG